MRMIATILLLAISGTAFAEDAEKVRVVTAEERKSCTYLGVVAIGSAWAWHTPRSALRQAFRKVEKMGGDSLFVIGQTSDWMNGATATGEALQCAKK